LCHATGLSQPQISRHLAWLKKSGLVVDRRHGQWVFYEISGDLPGWVRDVLVTAANGIGQSVPFVNDHKQLKQMKNRPERCRAA